MLSAYQGEDAATDLTSGTAKLLRVIIKKLVTNIQTEIHSFFPFFFLSTNYLHSFSLGKKIKLEIQFKKLN